MLTLILNTLILDNIMRMTLTRTFDLIGNNKNLDQHFATTDANTVYVFVGSNDSLTLSAHLPVIKH